MLGVAAVLVLVLLNGFFVATEFSIVAVRQSRLQQLAAEGRRSAKLATEIVHRLDLYIAACQFGITVASLGLGWVGEPAFAHLLEAPLESLVGDMADETAHGIATAVAFVLITSLHIVIGELAPKGIALQRAESTALLVARPMRIFTLIFRPPIVLLNGVGNAFLRLIGIAPASGHDATHSSEEIQYLLAGMQRRGTVEPSEARIAARAVDFADHTASSLMTPRPDIEAVPVEASREELVSKFLSSGHTRLPVHRQSLDDVVGFVHVHDVLEIAVAPPETYDLEAAVRDAMVIPETMGADDILQRLQESRHQLAVVVDEYGGTSGIVTLEDVIEALVGRIEEEPGLSDEDDSGAVVKWLGDGSALLDGRARIAEVEEAFGIDVDDLIEERVETIAGVMMTLLGRVPQPGDAVDIDGRTFTVESLDGRRLKQLRVSPPPASAGGGADAGRVR